MFSKPVQPMKGKAIPARRDVRRCVRRFAFLLLVVALGAVWFKVNVPALFIGQFSLLEKSPIAALNGCIQERFKSLDLFGISRMDPQHLKVFQPQSAAEKSAVANLEREGFDVVLYLVGSNKLESPEYFNGINRPITVTGRVEPAALPSSSELLRIAREAVRTSTWRNGYDTQVGKWHVAARLVRASQQKCLNCHNLWGNPKSRVRLGDTLGVVLYVYSRPLRPLLGVLREWEVV